MRGNRILAAAALVLFAAPLRAQLDVSKIFGSSSNTNLKKAFGR